MPINLLETKQPRVVIVGANFAGFTLTCKLSKKAYKVVLIDGNNFHQFPPLVSQSLHHSFFGT